MKSFLGWMSEKEKPKTSSKLMDYVLDGPKSRAEAERVLKERGVEKPQNPHPSRRMECAPDPHKVIDAMLDGAMQAWEDKLLDDVKPPEKGAAMGLVAASILGAALEGVHHVRQDAKEIQQCMDNQDAEYERQMAEYNQEVSRLMPKVPLSDRLPKSEMEIQGKAYWTEYWKCTGEYEAWSAKWDLYHKIHSKYYGFHDGYHFGWTIPEHIKQAIAENNQRYYELITADTSFLYTMHRLPRKYADYLQWRDNQFIPEDGLRYKEAERYSFQDISQRVHSRNSTRQESAMILDSLDQHLERTKPRFK